MSGAENRTRVEVGPDGAGARLDVYLAARLELSRTRVHKLIEEGRVMLDGKVPRKAEALADGQTVEVEVPEPVALALEPENLPLVIVYEDASLLVVDKAAGMVVHPSAGHAGGTMVNALLHHVRDLSGIGGTLRPGIVHRLDKGTSGLMVVAKSDSAHVRLSEALKRRKVRRVYQAATWGHLATEGVLVVDLPIDRDPANRKRMAVVEGGRRAVTRARVSERWRAAELLDVALETGRTHQIRVHLAHRGHPVVGDPLYGPLWERGMGKDRAWARDLSRRVGRPFLHAAELAFDHPETGACLRFHSPLPPDLAEAAAWARRTSGEAGPPALSSPSGAGDTSRPQHQASPRPSKE
ncbi:MAG: RluA family pseudouridine synthase [Gemmatimonadetes bacterium]|nr:RluA family pseudouridine synthase [Gemmatimonadota bacterium]